MAHLITGFAGVEHIQSADDGAFNASFFGEGQFVMEQGSQFEASIINNNTVRVLDGNGLMYGRHFRINPNEYEDMTIETGTAGTNRIDLIVMTYEKDANDGTETAYLQVIKGTASSGTPVVPSYTNGNILEGATKNQMPLYKVKIEGVVLSDIETLFTTIPTYKTLADEAYAKYIAKLEALQGSDLLDTMEEIEANTQSGKFAGALGVKEIEASINESLAKYTTVKWEDVTSERVTANKTYTIDKHCTAYLILSVPYNGNNGRVFATVNGQRVGIMGLTVAGENQHTTMTIPDLKDGDSLLITVLGNLTGNSNLWVYLYPYEL